MDKRTEGFERDFDTMPHSLKYISCYLGEPITHSKTHPIFKDKETGRLYPFEIREDDLFKLYMGSYIPK